MKPIIMSTEDVRAVLDGRKTMARLVIKPQPTHWYDGERVYDKDSIVGPEFYAPVRVDKNGEQYPGKEVYGIYSDDGGYGCKAPCQPGDVLWVRETWTCMRDVNTGEESYFFAATKLDRDTIETTYLCDDDGFETDRRFPWKPSIFMPKKIARLFLRVTDVRVERVQDISTSDCEREGIASDIDRFNGLMTPHHDWIVGEFARLWDARNAKRGYGWNSNPWVWVIGFEGCDVSDRRVKHD